MFKKYRTKIPRIHVDILGVHANFRGNPIFFAMCEKDKEYILIWAILAPNSIFFTHDTHNIDFL
jgi:hypothetical protein